MDEVDAEDDAFDGVEEEQEQIEEQEEEEQQEQEEQQEEEEQVDGEQAENAATNGEVEENMIEALPGNPNKHRVRMRRCLRTHEKAEEFIAQLSSFCERSKAAGEAAVFEDFDISQNLLGHVHFEAILNVLTENEVCVERFRGFGLPHLDDLACTALATWLQSVTSETAPCEMHLSDCAITAIGFAVLIEAFAANPAFPPADPKNPNRKFPMYLRLEHNYIDEKAIMEKVDEGVIALMRRRSHVKFGDETKCRLLVDEAGNLQQREGDPPNPEDAPPPRRVVETRFDRGDSSADARWASSRSYGKGRSKGKSWEAARAALPPPASSTRERIPISSGTGQRTSGSSRPSGRSDDAWHGSSKSDDAWHGSSKSSGRADAWHNDRSNGSWQKDSGYGRSDEPFDVFSRRGSDRNRSSSWSEGWAGSGSSGGWRNRQRGNDSAESSDWGRKRARGDDWRQGDHSSSWRTSRPKEPAKRPRKEENTAPLPDGWEAHWDRQYRCTYFFNITTGESVWERPDEQGE